MFQTWDRTAPGQSRRSAVGTVHMSTTNTTHYARLSCDTRWQPASHKMDPRFCKDAQRENSAKFGLLSKLEDIDGGSRENTPNLITIDKLKEKWGI
ncbi:hypothetical protein ElyMa_001263500 [Elysia marginata]|uniref:Uncharacterized protein n=1 Tax=Elysia marginata TaxID=1093978 RepID=A0AAV4IDM6_9GAST|nr:hypothetical protein ElyMa_001263500 [Elysia marginata]